MEVEAKFCIPDEEVFQRLLEVSTLGGLALGEPAVSGLQDTYLDTASRSILAGGYACRLRREAERFLITVKGLGKAEGGIHRREEHEFEVPGPTAPRDWPPGPARDLVLKLAGDQPLDTLFVIDQTRHDRIAHDGGRQVAQVSVQRVHVFWDDLPDPASAYLELETELKPDATDAELAAMSGEIKERWKLAPENRSKFERAMELEDGEGRSEPPEPRQASGPSAAPRLSAGERAIVERLANGPEHIARRARLLLAWDAGLPRSEVLAQSQLSARRTRQWLLDFRSRRLGIFPARLFQAAAEEAKKQTPAGAPPRDGPDLEQERAEAEEPGPSGPVAAAQEPGPYPEPAGPGAGEPSSQEAEPAKTPGLEPDDPMSEAGRKTLRFHFRRMVNNEAGSRLGEDPEAVHDMRVATRRMRAALRLFEPYYDPGVIGPIEKGLRRAGRMLGAVRDLDVFREQVQSYLDTLPAGQRGSLAPLLAALGARRDEARDELIAYLDGGKYARLKERLAEFVQTEGMGSLPPEFEGREPTPYRVRHVAPVVIYERLAAVRAFDEWVSIPNPPVTRLHGLRITSKRLRYTLEFLREVLGPDSKTVINQVVELQDHLGALQDAVVASGILRDFLVWGTWGEDLDRRSLPDLDAPVIAPGVAAYLAVKQSELQKLLDSFPPLWERFKGTDFSRQIAEAVSAL